MTTPTHDDILGTLVLIILIAVLATAPWWQELVP